MRIHPFANSSSTDIRGSWAIINCAAINLTVSSANITFMDCYLDLDPDMLLPAGYSARRTLCPVRSQKDK